MLALFLSSLTKADDRSEISIASESCIFFHNALCQNEFSISFRVFFFTYTSGYTSKHHLNFMLVTELQRRQNNSIAKHLKTVFSHPQYLFVAGEDPVSGHLTLIPGGSIQEPFSLGSQLQLFIRTPFFRPEDVYLRELPLYNLSSS